MIKTSKSATKAKKRFIQSLFLLFWLVLITINITGCSSPSQGVPGGQAPAVVTVWYSLTGQAEQELLNQFSRINEERPEVIVKGVRIPQKEFVEQVKPKKCYLKLFTNVRGGLTTNVEIGDKV